MLTPRFLPKILFITLASLYNGMVLISTETVQPKAWQNQSKKFFCMKLYRCCYLASRDWRVICQFNSCINPIEFFQVTEMEYCTDFVVHVKHWPFKLAFTKVKRESESDLKHKSSYQSILDNLQLEFRLRSEEIDWIHRYAALQHYNTLIYTAKTIH